MSGTKDDPVVLPDLEVTAPRIQQAGTNPYGSSYLERALSFVFELGEGSFGATGQNTVRLDGLRAHCTILKNGFPSMNSAEMRIYGIDPSVMNAITTLGSPRPMARLNTVTVLAGDNVNGMAVAYTGIVTEAWQNLSAQPETFLEVQSFAGTFVALKTVPPISFPGAADVATIMSGIATSAGRAFSNSGVQVTLSNPYFCGTALDQAHTLARAANIAFDDDGTTFFIWPMNGAKNGVIPLISPASGLVNYPDYTSQGIRLRTIFNPSLRFGGQVKVESSLLAANGVWYINSLSHDLSAQIPGGPFFTDIECDRLAGTVNG